MFLTDPAEIKEYLDKYFIFGDDTIDIVDGVVNVNGRIWFTPDGRKEIKNLAVQFGKVTGDCSFSKGKLESLVGSPSWVGGNFHCSENRKLRSLEGGPKYVGGDFWCEYCTKLKSLHGSPNEVGNTFSCRHCKIKTLEGSPRSVGCDVNCCACLSLVSLRGIPDKIGRLVEIQSTPLLDLADTPYVQDLALSIIDMPQPTAAGLRRLLNCRCRISTIGTNPWVGILQKLQRTGDFLEAAAAFERLYGEPFVLSGTANIDHDTELTTTLRL